MGRYALRFAPGFKTQLLTGEKDTTIRYDDEDYDSFDLGEIREGDRLDLLTESGSRFAEATVELTGTCRVADALGNVNRLGGTHNLDSTDELVSALNTYYDDVIDLSTEVRVIHLTDVEPVEDVREIESDKRAAFLMFDALERQVVAAVGAGEMEVAAETAEALFLYQSQLPEWTERYHEISEEFMVEEEAIGAAMESVYEWTVEEDHKARGWFE